MNLLRTHGLSAFYGDFQALFGIDLSVEDGETVVGRSNLAKLRTDVAWMPLVVVANEPVERMRVDCLVRDSPEQKAANGVATHQRVEQRADLGVAPNELSLDGRQHQLLMRDVLKDTSDHQRGLKAFVHRGESSRYR